jgi:hypothetical protein
LIDAGSAATDSSIARHTIPSSHTGSKATRVSPDAPGVDPRTTNTDRRATGVSPGATSDASADSAVKGSGVTRHTIPSSSAITKRSVANGPSAAAHAVAANPTATSHTTANSSAATERATGSTAATHAASRCLRQHFLINPVVLRRECGA